MKLLSLNLKAVGPFTDLLLDFSAGEHGLHLIYGPNEAGKSSTLRAVSYLLFGFPHLSTDNFIHPNDQLRVHGKLRHSGGEELELIRRRGTRNTLRGRDDSSVVADDELTRFLGGLKEDTFETLFGINHDRLTQAGEEIRTGRGQLGELLFMAGAGLTGLGQAQNRLKENLDALFRPKGQNPRINKALAELRGALDELKQRQLSSEEWQKHDYAYHQAFGTAEQVRKELSKVRSELERSRRLKAAIPNVVHYHDLANQLAALSGAVLLREEFGADSRAARDQLHLAENTISQSTEAIKAIAQHLVQINLPRMLLDAAADIEMVQEQLGAVEKASTDRIQLDQFRQDSEHRARQILRELGRPVDLGQAEQHRLRADEPPVVRALSKEFAKMRGEAAEARKAIVRQDDQIKRLEQSLAELKEPGDVEPLRSAVRQARLLGDVDTRLDEARARFQQADKKATVGFCQLPGWNQSATALEQMAIPLSASVDQLEAQLQDVTNQRRLLAEQTADLEESVQQLETRLQSLVLHQDVPTEGMLEDARARRERGWLLVKAAWLEGEPDQEELKRFLMEDPSETMLAPTYKRAVDRADEVADRLRREAKRVTQKAELLAQLARHRASLVAVAQERTSLADREARTERDWKVLVEPLGIGAALSSPAELRTWLRQRDEIVQLLAKRDDARHALEPLERASSTQATSLREALYQVGETISPSTGNLASLLDRAETVLDRHAKLVQTRTTLETQLQSAQAERAAAELSCRTAEVELKNWQSQWSAMMARIGLEPEASPEQAEVFLTKFSELFAKLDERRSHESRIRGIDRDASEFGRAVDALIEKLSPDFAGQPAGEQARELARRLRVAQADAQKHATLIEQRAREDAKLQTALSRRDGARVCLNRLCQEANCSEFDELDEAERRSRTRARLEENLAKCEEQMQKTAAGTDLADFIAEIERSDPATLDALIRDSEDKEVTLEEQLRSLDQTIGTERAELARMDGSDRAAETAEIAQTLLARIRGDVARYTTLKLAAAVMQRGIESYRERNQGPVLARASVLFASLTSGSFVKLQIDDDDNGQPVLKGVRRDGRLVGVEGMSDGSHDQLYLALRLASLEVWLESHEPIPFIVDDILLNFDDIRASAALGALLELSQKTQVLFFTHHRHIIELAQGHRNGGTILIHELPGQQTQNSA